MAMPRSLGDELFKSRRRKRSSLDGSVPGLPQERFHKSRRPVSGTPYVPMQGGYHHDLYNWGLPGEYHPSVNAPAVQTDEYDPDWDSHRIARTHDERPFGAVPQLEPGEAPFDYRHAQAMTRFFLKAMEVQYQHREDGQEVPSMADIWRAHTAGDFSSLSTPKHTGDSAADLAGAGEFASEELSPQGLPDIESMTDALSQLRQVFPEDHPDILRLEAAIQMVRHHSGVPDTNEPEMGPDYAAMEQAAVSYGQDLFGQQEAVSEQQGHALEDMLDGFGADAMPDMEALLEPDLGLEAMVEAPVDGYGDLGGLEQMVEQEDLFEGMPAEDMAEAMLPGMPDPFGAVDGLGFLTPEDEIDEAVDALTGQPGLQETALEPDPFQRQHDPFATAQEIFDQQMQFMANPFLMPGMMPMGPAPGM